MLLQSSLDDVDRTGRAPQETRLFDAANEVGVTLAESLGYG